jgi:methionine sulfoxide reductase heme-binding subunit
VHVISNPVTWYTARAAGVVAYVVLSTSVAFGIALAGRATLPGLPRFGVEEVHRFLGLLAGTFIAVHIVGIALDTTVPFSLSQLVVPFSASYRPLWTGLGVVAVELLLALAITNRLRGRIPYRVWRRAHMLNLVVWIAATGHGVMSGSDRDQAWLLAIYSLAAITIAAALAFRIGRVSHPVARILVPGMAAGAAFALVLGLASVPEKAPRRATAALAAPKGFSGGLDGTISTQLGQDAQLVSVSGEAGTASNVDFRIDLVTSGDRVLDTSLQLRFAGAGAPVCAGELSAIDNSGFTGTCSLADGTTRTVQGTWSVSENAVHGQLTSKA